MKKSLVKYLFCPSCKRQLMLKQFVEDSSGIEEGLLSCGMCGIDFPIINGIPRLLSPDLLSKLVPDYSPFLHKYGLICHATDVFTIYDSDEKIAKGFEYEWQKHSEILPEHEKEFLHVLGDVLPVEGIKGKVVLDAGCGQGRFSYFSNKYGAEVVISVDIGEQVLLAKRNLIGKDNIHVIQASIYNLPFEPVFDLIFSIGVIHHLPEPEKAFTKLYGLLKHKGRIFIWVYGYSSIIPVIRFFRKFTLNRNVRINRIWGFILALPLYSINQFYNFVKQIPPLRKYADRIPFHMYHDRSFSNIWTICFDKINSGIAVYYRREDLDGWLDRLSDKKTGIISERYPGRAGSSWRLMAERQEGSLE